jgi:hypothetical protein
MIFTVLFSSKIDGAAAPPPYPGPPQEAAAASLDSGEVTEYGGVLYYTVKNALQAKQIVDAAGDTKREMQFSMENSYLCLRCVTEERCMPSWFLSADFIRNTTLPWMCGDVYKKLREAEGGWMTFREVKKLIERVNSLSALEKALPQFSIMANLVARQEAGVQEQHQGLSLIEGWNERKREFEQSLMDSNQAVEKMSNQLSTLERNVREQQGNIEPYLQSLAEGRRIIQEQQQLLQRGEQLLADQAGAQQQAVASTEELRRQIDGLKSIILVGGAVLAGKIVHSYLLNNNCAHALPVSLATVAAGAGIASVTGFKENNLLRTAGVMTFSVAGAGLLVHSEQQNLHVRN